MPWPTAGRFGQVAHFASGLDWLFSPRVLGLLRGMQREGEAVNFRVLEAVIGIGAVSQEAFGRVAGAKFLETLASGMSRKKERERKRERKAPFSDERRFFPRCYAPGPAAASECASAARENRHHGLGHSLPAGRERFRHSGCSAQANPQRRARGNVRHQYACLHAVSGLPLTLSLQDVVYFLGRSARTNLGLLSDDFLAELKEALASDDTTLNVRFSVSSEASLFVSHT